MLLSVMLLWSCGPNPLCHRLAAASDRFFVQSMNIGCDSPEIDGPHIQLWSRQRFSNRCNDAMGKCSGADSKAVETYIACLEAAPACSEANQDAAAKAVDACAKAVVAANLSPDCVVALE